MSGSWCRPCKRGFPWYFSPLTQFPLGYSGQALGRNRIWTVGTSSQSWSVRLAFGDMLSSVSPLLQRSGHTCRTATDRGTLSGATAALNTFGSQKFCEMSCPQAAHFYKPNNAWYMATLTLGQFQNPTEDLQVINSKGSDFICEKLELAPRRQSQPHS